VFPTLKEFLKSVNSWWSYCKKLDTTFLKHSVEGNKTEMVFCSDWAWRRIPHVVVAPISSHVIGRANDAIKSSRTAVIRDRLGRVCRRCAPPPPPGEGLAETVTAAGWSQAWPVNERLSVSPCVVLFSVYSALSRFWSCSRLRGG